MRLVDCTPIFYAEPGRQGQGISFDCPLCVKEGRLSIRGPTSGPPMSQRTETTFAARFPCAFRNPIDGGAPERPMQMPDGTLKTPTYWLRTGTTFEGLTMSASVDGSGQDHKTHRGWHGNVVAGEIQGGGV